MYHQHLQHRQGHAYFVPPAMCQQLLEVARRVSRPPQQPPRQHQPHTSAYLAVLESGLSTQKKPAKRPDEETPPEPPPLEEILGRDPEELEPGELQTEPAELEASSNGGMVAEAATADAPPLPAQQGMLGSHAASDSAGSALDLSQQVDSAGGSAVDVPGLPGDVAERSADTAAHDHAVHPEEEPKPSSSLLERFDAARQQHGRDAGAALATSGAPAEGAKPARTSLLGKEALPMLSPLVLSSAPNHTPVQAGASSAPAAQDQAFSFGQPRQLQLQSGNSVNPQQGQAAGLTSTEMTPQQIASPEGDRDAQPEGSGDAQAAEPSSFSFAVASAGLPAATPPSFVKLLQEYGSTSGKPPAETEQSKQPAQGEQCVAVFSLMLPFGSASLVLAYHRIAAHKQPPAHMLTTSAYSVAHLTVLHLLVSPCECKVLA